MIKVLGLKEKKRAAATESKEASYCLIGLGYSLLEWPDAFAIAMSLRKLREWGLDLATTLPNSPELV